MRIVTKVEGQLHCVRPLSLFWWGFVAFILGLTIYTPRDALSTLHCGPNNGVNSFTWQQYQCVGGCGNPLNCCPWGPPSVATCGPCPANTITALNEVNNNNTCSPGAACPHS